MGLTANPLYLGIISDWSWAKALFVEDFFYSL